MKKTKHWLESQTLFLTEFYPKFGKKYCYSNLKKTKAEIDYKVRKLKLKKNVNVNTLMFSECQTPEAAYVLGFIWADGHVNKDGRHIAITCLLDDMNNIEHIFDKTGKWSKYTLDRTKNHCRTAKEFMTSNHDLNAFLCKNDYRDKSKKSPDSILETIPISLHEYFYRGVVDGDGCFYYNQKNFLRQFSISGSYEQNWSYLECLCNRLNIKYTIKRTTTKKGNSSSFRILGKEVLKIGNFIYSKNDNIKLSRKYNKFIIIKNSYIKK